ncbi:MAG TPA: amidase [Xanthobacteraceae bacterium]|nr:amidase [Xanthobacteraceae bacterium]
MADISTLTAADLVRLYRRRELSPVEVVRDVLARIERFNPTINAFVLVDGEGALAAARESEARWANGTPLGLIDGVPATVKDNILAKGWPCRRGSPTTSDAPVTEDAPSVARLREQGAPILGKTTLPEYGWIGACHSPLTGITRNPWNLDRTPGGSSGGAAAAALLNLGWLHLGTDGAGSIRIPAAFTGVFGIKPSFGRVAAYPASPFTMLAHVGPLTRTVTDAATMLSVISGPDVRDMAAWNTPAPDFRIGLGDGLRGVRIAWSPRLGYIKNVDPEVEKLAAESVRVFEEFGAEVHVEDPPLPDAAETIRTLWYAVSANIVDSVPAAERGKMDPGFLRIAEYGRRYSLADWFAAYTRRSEFANIMARFHTRYDLLLTPQMPIPALEAGLEAPASGAFGDQWVQWSPYTYPFNITQQPAASVPCGFAADGLPVGLQIVGPTRGDALVLRAARAFESARPFATLSEPKATR